MDLKVNSVSFDGRARNLIALPRELRKTFKTFRAEYKHINTVEYLQGIIKFEAYLFELPSRLAKTFKECMKNKA